MILYIIIYMFTFDLFLYFFISFQAELAQQNACERFEHMSARAKEGMDRNYINFLN